jgi:hypothetical protein
MLNKSKHCVGNNIHVVNFDLILYDFLRALLLIAVSSVPQNTVPETFYE